MNNQANPPAGDDNARQPNIKVNQKTCIGCGICVSIAPDTFEMNEEGKSQVKENSTGENAEEAKEACPVGAITIE
jgi:ferredoxin